MSRIPTRFDPGGTASDDPGDTTDAGRGASDEVIGPRRGSGRPTLTEPSVPLGRRVVAIDTLSPPARAARDVQPGTWLGQFEIERCIGRGAMGTVYVAHDCKLGRRVAVKLLGSAGSSSASRFVRESHLMAQLAHPNIVVVYDAGETDGRLFIAMELVDGEVLPVWLARPHHWRDIVRMFDQAGRGLAAAHSAGIVHRDFKPANVLVGADGRARVADFGVAHWADAATTTETAAGSTDARAPRDEVHTATGLVLGTPAYMAPEHRRAERTTPLSDQYSFCVSLWEALFGVRPEVAAAVRARPAGPLRSADPGRLVDPARSPRVPKAVRRVIERGLAEQPNARWPSMSALLDALATAVGQRRRVAVATLVVVAATVAVAVAALRLDRPALLACHPAHERLTGLWDDVQKAAMHRAFAATQLPYAAQQWQSVERTIDRYAAAWTARSDQVCAAGARATGLALAQLEQHRVCLDRRLDHLAAWLHVFGAPGPELVRNAAQAAAGLDDLALCDDAEAVDEPLPADPVLAGRVKLLRASLATESIRAGYGSYKQSVEVLRGILSEARQRGYRPLIAEALAAIGGAEQDASEPKAALATWLALRDLSEETHQDLQRANAWSGLAFAYGNLFQYDKAHDAVQVATAILRPMSGPAAQRLRIGLDMDEANASWGEGRREQALALFRKAAADTERLLGTNSYRLARIEIDIAALLVEQRRFDEAEAVYARALARFVAMDGDAHPGAATIVNNQGNLYFLKGDYARAFERYHEALAIKDRAGIPADNLGRAYTILNLGETLVRLGRTDEALAALRPALATITAQLGEDNAYFVEASTWLGLAELAAGRAADALPRLEHALAARQHEAASSAELAEVQLGLARALWEVRPAQRARARELAISARAGFAIAHDEQSRAQTDAWLARHPR